MRREIQIVPTGLYIRDYYLVYLILAIVNISIKVFIQLYVHNLPYISQPYIMQIVHTYAVYKNAKKDSFIYIFLNTQSITNLLKQFSLIYKDVVQSSSIVILLILYFLEQNNLIRLVLCNKFYYSSLCQLNQGVKEQHYKYSYIVQKL